MRVADFSPHTLRAAGAIVGLVGGIAGGWLADKLPPRYEIEHLVTGSARARRNAVLWALSIACGVGLAHAVTRVPDASLARAAVFFATNLVLSVAVLAAAAVDLEHMILPNEVTLGGAAFALLTAHFRGLGLVPSAAGAVVGLVLTYLPFAIYKKLRGRSGMGLGDAKLALLAGTWLGPEGVVFVVFAGAVQSALAALVMRVLGLSFGVPASVQAELDALRAKADAGDAEARELLADDPMAADLGAGEGAQSVMTMRLPMGPFLVLSCLEFLFARRVILEVFDRLLRS